MNRITYESNIATTFGKSLLKGARVGIELEFEQADLGQINTVSTPYWKYDIDHSLRGGGLEFISLPLRPSHITPALVQAKAAIRECNGVVNKRCGVHVHINMTDLNFMQLWQMSTYYAIVEPFIFKEFADGREDSHFCVPTWANTNLQQNFYNDAISLYRGIMPRKKSTTATQFQALSTQQVGGGIGGSPTNPKAPLRILTNPKYAAMNFTSLPTFGTVEFRQARGTTSMSWVHSWVEFLLKLREQALKFESADAIIDEYERTGFLTLCENINLKQRPDVNPDHITDAVDAAIMMVGHGPTDHHDLNWEIK